jgi:hypothetical protein
MRRLAVVGIYAAAMAWVESAVVFDLRTMIGRLLPYQPDPLPNFGGLGAAEMVREIATLIMLIAVGMLAGKTARSRWAYAVFAFGLWDILYYVFLIPLTGWPRSPFDWDILFLLPLPWWAPVAAPAGIALLMIGGGGCIAWLDSRDRPLWPGIPSFLAGGLGVLLALYTFMSNSIAWLGGGEDALRHNLPVSFPWILFLLAYTLMLIPVLDLLRQAWRWKGGQRGTGPWLVRMAFFPIHPGTDLP